MRRQVFLGGLFSLILIPSLAFGQATISGIVTDAETGNPIPGTQVIIDALSIGAISDAEGNYALVAVPAGAHILEARFVGYETAERDIDVVAGESYQINFELNEDALLLDEVIVTGTAGNARRREVGNSIAQIDMSKVEEPVGNVDQVLSGRVPGLNLQLSSGAAGSGALIRLRGNTSATMSNAPLIYIDGVRVRSDAYPKNVPPVGYQGRSSNTQSSPLNDLNPNDIARVEVIKGAAATTLYGTEAAGGVIQIFTKRGRVGRPEWTVQVDQGLDYMQKYGTDNLKYLGMEPFIDMGYRQKYQMSVGGGGEELRYFLSGSFFDNDGSIDNSYEDGLNLRANFGFSPLSNLQVNVTTAFSDRDIQNAPQGNNAHGLTLNAYRGRASYFGTPHDDPAFEEELRTLLDYQITSGITRFTTGAEAIFEPIKGFTHKFTAGYDRSDIENRNYRPFGFERAPQGILSNQSWLGTTVTLEYIGSYSWNPSSDFKNTLSFGGQKVDTEFLSILAYGEGLPPGEATVSGAAQQLSREENQKVVNAGFFGQTLFGLKDRYFLTLGGRVDGNSAFGGDFGLQFYPKISASYILSEESFWPQGLGSMKLRAAWGQAGRAPGTFDAVRTWDPVGWGGSVAFEPLNVGNPELGPETTTEIELGLEAAFLNEKLTVDFSWYDAITEDALFNVRQLPSLGFLESQLENVGELSNKGVELAIQAAILNKKDWGLDLGFTLATNHSEITSLGGAAGFSVAGFSRIEEGQPAPVVVGRKILNPNEFADPIFETRDDGSVNDRAFYGPNLPTETIGAFVTLRMPLGISLFARGEYMGGHYIGDGASSNLARRGAYTLCDDINAYTLIAAGDVGSLTAWQRAMCDAALVGGSGNIFIYPADFFKLRELTLAVPLPIRTSAIQSARIAISGRNIIRWLNDDFPVFDPEMVSRVERSLDEQIEADDARSISEHVPAPASWTFSLRFRFR